jgi:2-oxoglutarate ferredoxin oxidoreductase subunit beta
MKATLERAANHKGSAFVEILQNCVIFADKVHEDYYGVKTRKDTMLYLHPGEPMLYGKTTERGIAHGPGRLENIDAAGNQGKVIIHDEKDENLAYLLAGLHHPEHPVPVGVFRAVERPTYDELITGQVEKAKEMNGEANLEKLVRGSKTWKVE